MSNFSLPKNMPPALPTLTPEKVWKKLREPFTIAILASLGFHGLLWVGLPLMSSSTPKQPEQRTLNVVELSPLEQQARLPQMPNLLQPVAPSPKLSPTAPPTGAVPMVPVNPTLTNPGAFYPIPNITTQRATPGFTIGVKPAAPKPTAPSPKSTNPEVPESPEPPDEAEQTSTRSQDLAPTPGKPLSKNRADQEKAALQQRFAFSATGTSEQDYQANAALIATQIADKFNIRDWEKPIATRSPYPPEACPFQHEGKPVKGVTGLVVIMQPDGSLADTALMVKSSGFKGLDEAARQYVEKNWSEIAKQNKLEPESKPTAYPLAITVEPAEGECAAKPVS